MSNTKTSVRIVVDCREDSLLTRMNAVAAEYAAVPGGTVMNIESKSLHIGDIAFVDGTTGKETVLFERKTLQDLLSSIKDGRYDEQSHRLTHASGIPAHNIYYVLEGLMSQLRTDAERRLVYSSITSLSYFKGFSVLRTSTVQETADLLVAMARKMEKDGDKGRQPFIKSDSQPNSDPSIELADTGNHSNHNSYSQFVKKEKKENITESNIGEIMLSQIPGVSSATAGEILALYGGSLLKVVEECAVETPFSAVVLRGSNGKPRKLGSNVKEALVKYLGKMRSVEST